MIEINPQVAVWEYTLKCNSKCIHCGSDAKKARPDELDTAESLDLVKQLADLGFVKTVLSGGEPTMKEDWKKISEKIRAEGMDLRIIRNALRWNHDTIDTIAGLEPFAVGFSVDGEKELHDYLRGAKGSHKKIFKHIKEMKSKDVTVCAVTSVNSLNLGHLPMMRNRMIVYGVDAWQLQMASPMGRMTENKDLLLDEDEYRLFGEFIAETREKLPYMNVQAGDCVGYFGSLEPRIRDTPWKGCAAGIQGIGIESNGNIKGCLSIQSPEAVEGNIRKNSLKEIWNDHNNFKYTRGFKKEDLKGGCKGCDYGTDCRGGCQSQSMAFFEEFNNAPYCLSRHENNKI